MKSIHAIAVLLGGTALAVSCNNMKQIKLLPYPDAERGDVIDN